MSPSEQGSETMTCVKWLLKRVESLDKILLCYHSDETSGSIVFQNLTKWDLEFCKKIINVDFGHFWVWKGESISGSYLGFLRSI